MSTESQPARSELIASLFADSRRANEATLARMTGAVERAADAMLDCCLAGGKILACGNGGSSGDAQHLTSELVNRFERERRALAAIALVTESSTLTAIANDYGYDRVFSRQVEAFGRAGDILVAISTSGNSANVALAMQAAQSQGMQIIAFTGRDGGQMAELMGDHDIELRAAHDSTARIQEMHLLMIHCVCRLIEDRLIG